MKPPLPFSPGSELSGVVKAVGDGVTRVKPGDRVMAFTGYGAFAEEVKTQESRLLPMPAGHGLPDGRVVHPDLRDVGSRAERPRRAGGRRDAARARRGRRRRPGGRRDRQGARRARRSPAPRATRSSPPAARTAPTRRSTTPPKICASGSRRITDGRGVDVVYDAVGGAYTEPALRSTAWRGRLLVVGFAAGDIPRIPLNLTLLKGCSIVGVFWGDFARREPERFAASVRQLGEWFEQGKLKPHVSATLPLDRAAEALADDGVAQSDRKTRPDTPLAGGLRYDKGDGTMGGFWRMSVSSSISISSKSSAGAITETGPPPVRYV